jgi:hypothetical protein
LNEKEINKKFGRVMIWRGKFYLREDSDRMKQRVSGEEPSKREDGFQEQ